MDGCATTSRSNGWSEARLSIGLLDASAWLTLAGFVRITVTGVPVSLVKSAATCFMPLPSAPTQTTLSSAAAALPAVRASVKARALNPRIARCMASSLVWAAPALGGRSPSHVTSLDAGLLRARHLEGEMEGRQILAGMILGIG